MIKESLSFHLSFTMTQTFLFEVPQKDFSLYLSSQFKKLCWEYVKEALEHRKLNCSMIKQLGKVSSYDMKFREFAVNTENNLLDFL
jgi:hypothetical protein